jgi:hypothetical protein
LIPARALPVMLLWTIDHLERSSKSTPIPGFSLPTPVVFLRKPEALTWLLLIDTFACPLTRMP